MTGGWLVFLVRQNYLKWTFLFETLPARWSNQAGKIILTADQLAQWWNPYSFIPLTLNRDKPIKFVCMFVCILCTIKLRAWWKHKRISLWERKTVWKPLTHFSLGLHKLSLVVSATGYVDVYIYFFYIFN